MSYGLSVFICAGYECRLGLGLNSECQRLSLRVAVTSSCLRIITYGAYNERQVGVPPPSTEEGTQSLKEELPCPIIPSVGSMMELTS